jgi:Uma2 family endonuclease
VLPDVEVLVEAGHTPTVRAPDLVVVPSARAEQNPPQLTPADIRLAIEIVSPGTGRTHRVMKMSEYAEAGIPHYWLVDLPPRLQLTAYTLGSGQHEQRAIGTDLIDLDQTSPVHLDLKALLTPLRQNWGTSVRPYQAA